MTDQLKMRIETDEYIFEEYIIDNSIVIDGRAWSRSIKVQDDTETQEEKK